MLTEMGDEVDGDGNEERNRAEESKKGMLRGQQCRERVQVLV